MTTIHPSIQVMNYKKPEKKGLQILEVVVMHCNKLEENIVHCTTL